MQYFFVKDLVRACCVLGPFRRALGMVAHLFPPHSHPGNWVLFIPLVRWGTEWMMQWVVGQTGSRRVSAGSCAHYHLRGSEGGAGWHTASGSQLSLPVTCPSYLFCLFLSFLSEHIGLNFLFCGPMMGSALELTTTLCPFSSPSGQIWAIKLGVVNIDPTVWQKSL